MSEYEGRVTTQEAQAKRALAEAHEAGDYEKLADAQAAISQIAMKKSVFVYRNNVLNSKHKSMRSTRTMQQCPVNKPLNHNSVTQS